MREYVSTITQRGQVTIPAEVRRLLGANPRDKIAFRVEGDTVRLVPVEFTLEQVFGSVTPLHRPEDFDDLSRRAKDEKAKQTLREMQSG
jgi:antitoxin PrlF